MSILQENSIGNEPIKGLAMKYNAQENFLTIKDI